MAEIEYRLIREWNVHAGLTLGELRTIVAEADRRRMADSCSVDVDDRAAWISGRNPDGSKAKKYPKGNGGHYVTKVTIDGPVDITKPLPLPANHEHEYHLRHTCACGEADPGHSWADEARSRALHPAGRAS